MKKRAEILKIGYFISFYFNFHLNTLIRTTVPDELVNMHCETEQCDKALQIGSTWFEMFVADLRNGNDCFAIYLI